MRVLPRTPRIRPSYDLFVLVSIVHRLVLRPAIHFEMFQLGLSAPVERLLHGFRSDQRIVGTVRVGVRPLVDRQQVLHQTNHAVPFQMRHV